MGPPLIIALLLAKKAVSFGLYKAAKDYGYHRIYRRLAEGIRDSKRLTVSEKHEVRRHIKSAFRLPSSMLSQLSNSEVGKFYIEYREVVLKNVRLPPFFRSVVEILDSLPKLPSMSWFSRLRDGIWKKS